MSGRVDGPPPGKRPRPTWLSAAMGSVGFVVLLYVMEGVDTVADNRLDLYGVRPRSDEGLVGVLLAPLLHAGWVHLEANTVPALVLLFLVLVTGIARGVAATAIIWVVGGLGVWLVAPANEIHLGASTLIFGWVVHTLLRGFWDRSGRELLIGVLVLLAYGGILVGVVPSDSGVSWQGHLFGALGGGLAAYLLGRRRDDGPGGRGAVGAGGTRGAGGRFSG
ncbi:rhomboid family intramembrane serine protease [Nocardioides litoris]|uniref:rhomboid family intramembrane serine protease n=1 Tax=Nocardioides litoris TaxID=1926648 RepID=UPI001FEBBBA1|nr:rhomboid family intramembrane serine protease [Nocardioides litoris]